MFFICDENAPRADSRVANKVDPHIFTRAGVEEIINLQPLQGKAKAYQVRQVRGIFLRYEIRMGE